MSTPTTTVPTTPQSLSAKPGTVALSKKKSKSRVVRLDAILPSKSLGLAGRPDVGSMKNFLKVTDPDRVYSILQSVDLGYLNSGTTNQYNSIYFTLNVLPNYTTFSSLFDQYRIVRVRVMFIPTANAIPVVTSSLSTYPVFLYAVDFDDSNFWTTEAQALSYENIKIIPMFEKSEVIFRPHAIVSSLSGGSVNVESPWIDTASTAVSHFGVKTCITSGAAAALYPAMRMFAQVEVELRNVI